MVLPLAAIAPEDHAAETGKGHHAPGRQERQAGEDFRRMVAPGLEFLGRLSRGMVVGAPLRQPVGALARPMRFQPGEEFVDAMFQSLGLGVHLILRKAFRKNRLDMVHGVSLEQIQHHGVADDELAVHRLGTARQAARQDAQVHVGRRGDNGEPHAVLAAAPGPP